MIEDQKNLCSFTPRELSKVVPIGERAILSDIKEKILDVETVGQKNYIGFTTKVVAQRNDFKRYIIKRACNLDMNTFDVLSSGFHWFQKIGIQTIDLYLRFKGYSSIERLNILDFIIQRED